MASMTFDFVGRCKGLAKPLIFFIWLALLSAGLASCQAASTETVPSLTLPVTLIPYYSATPEKLSNSPGSANSTVSPSQTPTALPTPTPTPYTYLVKKGDTLLGIALHYGLTLEALQAANPKVNPNFLSVGTELVIPIAQASKIPTATPSPTPLPLSINAPRCFPQGETGAWCVAQISNGQPYAVDNLQVWFSLADSSGTVLTHTQVTPFLDWIPAGNTLPFLAFFPADHLPAAVQELTARAALSGANPVPAQGSRYLPLRVQVSQVQISPDGLQADLQGQIDYPLPAAPQADSGALQSGAAASPTPQPTLPPEQIKANVIWVLAVAYDAHGQVVGARRWEADKGLKPSGSMGFALTIYSLGPPIDHVDAILEARNQ
jgi:LysM repeat protein